MKMRNEAATATTEPVPIPEFTASRVVEAFNALLDQWQPPAEFTCLCSADRLLGLMVAKVGAHGLPRTGSALLAFLKLPDNIRAIRKERILVSFEMPPRAPSPREQTVDPATWPPNVRLERARHQDEFRPRPS